MQSQTGYSLVSPFIIGHLRYKMDLYLFDKTKEMIKTVVERDLQQIILCVRFRLSKLMSTLREVKN